MKNKLDVGNKKMVFQGDKDLQLEISLSNSIDKFRNLVQNDLDFIQFN